jgi:hypothetical protein
MTDDSKTSSTAPTGCAPVTVSVVTDADLAKCVANVPHNWGKWQITDKLICTNWGTVSIIQKRQCGFCGLTQMKRQSV